MSGPGPEDFRDEDILDEEELGSPGTTAIFTGATVVSTASGTQLVTLSGVDLFRAERLENGDFVTLAGTGGADGNYTVDEVQTIDSFTVNEPIANSAGGTCDAIHPAAATKIGVDPTTLPGVTATDLQTALLQIIGLAGSDDPFSLFNNINESYELLSGYTDGVLTSVLAHVPGVPADRIRIVDQFTNDADGLVTGMRVRQYAADRSTVVETLTLTGGNTWTKT